MISSHCACVKRLKDLFFAVLLKTQFHALFIRGVHTDPSIHTYPFVCLSVYNSDSQHFSLQRKRLIFLFLISIIFLLFSYVFFSSLVYPSFCFINRFQISITNFLFIFYIRIPISFSSFDSLFLLASSAQFNLISSKHV